MPHVSSLTLSEAEQDLEYCTTLLQLHSEIGYVSCNNLNILHYRHIGFHSSDNNSKRFLAFPGKVKTQSISLTSFNLSIKRMVWQRLIANVYEYVYDQNFVQFLATFEIN